MKTKAYYFILSGLLGCFSSAGQDFSTERYFVEVAARSGEDVDLLLRRFGMADYPCNAERFGQLNKTSADQILRDGKRYLLPIEIVTYNGKSIRTTLDISDWQTAKRIEKFNRLMQRQKLRDDDFVVSKELWVPWHELECPGEGSLRFEAQGSRSAPTKHPPAVSNPEPGTGKDRRTFQIFGPGYQKTPLLSQRLRGRIYYLISGHAGPDPGAQGKRAGHTLCEDEYAYDVTLRLHRLLLSHGAISYMIVRDPNDGIRDAAYLNCDQDEKVYGNLPIPRQQKERLLQRTDLINELTAKHTKAGQTNQTIIEIHVDSRGKSEKIDAFFYYRPDSDASLALAKKLHNKFRNKYQAAQGGRNYEGTVSERGLLTLVETTAKRAVYIELGNIQNDWDQQRIVLKNNRQAIANWLSQALLAE